MMVRFLIDPDTDLPHIEQHGVTPSEVLDIFRGPADHGPANDGARMAEGQTRSGRHLRVIYRQNDADSSILVITAYDLIGRAKLAYRRRRRRRR
jgi:hypothetical protein